MIALRILIVIALQTAALGYMIIDRQAMLDSSRIVTLKVVPVDPRDIFRGDYVVLNYAISRLDVHTLEGEDSFSSGDVVFVTMQKQGEDWKAVAIRRAQPLMVQGGVPILATVQFADGSQVSGQPSWVTLTYGIESYFVPQGTGHAIEDEARKGELSADIAVDGKGRAAIKAMRRNGQVFYVEGIF